MKTFVNYNVDDPSRLRATLYALAERSFEVLHRWWFGPGDMVLPDGIAYIDLVNSVSPAIVMPPGIASSAFAQGFVNQHVVTGRAYVDVYYSGSSTSNNFKVTAKLTPVSLSGLLDSGTLTVADASVAPPASAKALQTVELGSFAMDGDDELFALQIERDGATDTNAGDFYLVGARVRFYADRV